jgi:hypothetical protein
VAVAAGAHLFLPMPFWVWTSRFSAELERALDVFLHLEARHAVKLDDVSAAGGLPRWSMSIGAMGCLAALLVSIVNGRVDDP